MFYQCVLMRGREYVKTPATRKRLPGWMMGCRFLPVYLSARAAWAAAMRAVGTR